MRKLIFLTLLLICISLTPYSFSEGIPDWVKNNASWWSERLISQSEFTNGLEFLINEGIIYIPFAEPGIPGPDKSIPDWVRNTAGWWSNDLIPDSEFINAMKYLIEIGIIDVNATSPENIIDENIIDENVQTTSSFNIVLDGYDIVHSNRNFNLDVKVFDSDSYSGNEFSIHRKGIDGVNVNIQLFNQESELIHTFDSVTQYNGLAQYEVLAKETSQGRSGMSGGGLWLIGNAYTVKVTATLDGKYGENSWEFVGVPHEQNYNQVPSKSSATAYNTNGSSFYQTLDITSSGSTGADIDTPEGLIFNKNGSRMFIPDNNDDKIYQFKLHRAWDIGSAVLSHSSAATGEGGTDHVEDLAFSSDGHKMFIIERDSDKVLEYDLSIPWDISSTSMSDADSDFTIDNGITNNPEDIAFNPTGTKMYILDNDDAFDSTEEGDQVFEYKLSTAWDVSTAEIESGGHFTIIHAVGAPDAFEFSTDGKLLFIVDPEGFDRLIKYRLDTAWDVSTAKSSTGIVNLVDIVRLETKEGATKGLAFGDNGRKFFITGKGTDGSSPSVNQWNLP